MPHWRSSHYACQSHKRFQASIVPQVSSTQPRSLINVISHAEALRNHACRWIAMESPPKSVSHPKSNSAICHKHCSITSALSRSIAVWRTIATITRPMPQPLQQQHSSIVTIISFMRTPPVQPTMPQSMPPTVHQQPHVTIQIHSRGTSCQSQVRPRLSTIMPAMLMMVGFTLVERMVQVISQTPIP